MLAATYHLQALDPLWFRGLGPSGNSWDPALIHATALNFALLKALGFADPHRRFNVLWVAHSLPYRTLGLWMSPAEVVPGTAEQVQVFRGGTEGGKMRMQEPKDKNTSPYVGMHIGVRPDGSPRLMTGKPSSIGKPFRTSGYLGEWTGVVFAEDVDAAALIPHEAFLIRLGPNRVPVALKVGAFEEVKETADSGFSTHLSDPALLPADVTGIVHYAKPFPLMRAVANGVTSFGPVRTFPIRRK